PAATIAALQPRTVARHGAMAVRGPAETVPVRGKQRLPAPSDSHGPDRWPWAAGQERRAMQELSAQGRRIVGEVAERHGLSVEAVTVLLHALIAGNGSMAQ